MSIIKEGFSVKEIQKQLELKRNQPLVIVMQPDTLEGMIAFDNA